MRVLQRENGPKTHFIHSMNILLHTMFSIQRKINCNLSYCSTSGCYRYLFFESKRILDTVQYSTFPFLK
jgi:hypothetical protein